MRWKYISVLPLPVTPKIRCAKFVEEFLIEAFNIVDLDWNEYVITSEKYYRPNEVDYLLGDSSKIKKTLGWEPQVDFKQLVKMMVENDLNEAEKEKSG